MRKNLNESELFKKKNYNKISNINPELKELRRQ